MDTVGPTHAGVFPLSAITDRPSSRRPRPRGGVPGTVMCSNWLNWSAPPTRGCSHRAASTGPPDVVGPAHAGVFRGASRRDGHRSGRPRRRGGVPVTCSDAIPGPQSAPPTRGCSGGAPVVDAGGEVGPAHAGVFPLAGRVGPAHAGVFRRRPRPSRSTRCRPRPRGGVPLGRAWSAATRASAPPTRGCSDGSKAPVAAWTRQPRPRGGVPDHAPHHHRVSRSAPPTRGCSACATGVPAAASVGPAHAGVFRIRLVVGVGGSCRPRPRGGVPRWAASSSGMNLSAPLFRGVCGASRTARGIRLPEEHQGRWWGWRGRRTANLGRRRRM